MPHIPHRVKDYFYSGEEFLLWQCQVCGFVFTNPVPEESKSSYYYRSDRYISHTDSYRKQWVTRLYHIARQYMLRQKYKYIQRYVSEPDTMLDIGCGTGYFMQYMKQRGWRVKGIEPDERASSFAQSSFGLEVYPPSYFLSDLFNNESFRVITLWHVLEHLYDPPVYLQKIHSLLCQDGYLFVAVPNVRSYDAWYFGQYWAAYDVPRHLWHFSPDTLQRFLSSHGFEWISSYRLPLDVFYVSLLSAQYKSRFYWPEFIWASMIGFVVSCINKNKTSSLVHIFKKI